MPHCVSTRLDKRAHARKETCEPIAMAGRTGVVAGTSAVVVKDRRTNQCHVAITIGSAMAMAPGIAGNECRTANRPSAKITRQGNRNSSFAMSTARSGRYRTARAATL